MNENVRTTVRVRGKKFLLKREWLNGLWSWAVFDGDKKIGWVLQKWDLGVVRGKWACVPVPETKEDEYNQIWYDYQTRDEALKGLVPKDK